MSLNIVFGQIIHQCEYLNLLLASLSMYYWRNISLRFCSNSEACQKYTIYTQKSYMSIFFISKHVNYYHDGYGVIEHPTCIDMHVLTS